jgi:anhydro-N-acetylmuramic acid kinase
MRTFTEHIALQIAIALPVKGTLFITGGGAYNDFLIERIFHLPSIKIIIPENTILEFKKRFYLVS